MLLYFLLPSHQGLLPTYFYLVVLIGVLVNHLPNGFELPTLSSNGRKGLQEFASLCEAQCTPEDLQGPIGLF